MTDEWAFGNKENYKKMVDTWLESMNMMITKIPAIPSVGPLQTSQRRIVAIGAEMAKATDVLANFNKHLGQYYALTSGTWMEATKKLLAKCPPSAGSQDLEKLQQTWIDTFEDEFTNFFNSENFATVIGNMLKSEAEFYKHMSNIAEIISRNLDIPTRSEINDIYEEIAKIKRSLKKLSSGVEEMEGVQD